MRVEEEEYAASYCSLADIPKAVRRPCGSLVGSMVLRAQRVSLSYFSYNFPELLFHVIYIEIYILWT